MSHDLYGEAYKVNGRIEVNGINKYKVVYLTSMSKFHRDYKTPSLKTLFTL